MRTGHVVPRDVDDADAGVGEGGEEVGGEGGGVDGLAATIKCYDV